MDTTYCVILTGVIETAKLNRVVAELAFTFKRSHDKTVKMLARIPCAVRREVDFRTAVKYETLLRSCGCVCTIETEPFETAVKYIAADADTCDTADCGVVNSAPTLFAGRPSLFSR